MPAAVATIRTLGAGDAAVYHALRLRMLREACQVIHAMWRDDYATFAGQRYQIDGAINEPKGARGR